MLNSSNYFFAGASSLTIPVWVGIRAAFTFLVSTARCTQLSASSEYCLAKAGVSEMSAFSRSSRFN